MARRTVVLQVGERLVEFSVDRDELAENLRFRNRANKALKLRPGQKANLTGTDSDPISPDVLATMQTILREYSENKHS
jgi:hypothetical protein